MKSQLPRRLELDRMIRAGQYPNALTFAKKWEASQKSIQRDIEYLRLAGAPLEYDPTRKGYYYTDQHWFLPALSMSEGDLFGLLIAATALEQYCGTPIAKQLEQTFTRLAALLPAKLTVRPELIFSRFTFTGPPAKPVDESVWLAILRGLLRQRSVRITYRTIESPRDKDRLIDPYHIANIYGEWYVIAHDHRLNGISRFAIANIQDTKVTDMYFRLPEDFDAQKFLSSAFGQLAGYGPSAVVKLRLDKEIVPQLLPNDWQPSEYAKQRPDGSVELTTQTCSLFEIARSVLAWGPHVTVISPITLKRIVEDEIKLMGKNR